uniref:Uncharacterized protein n=1 Tax=Solanum lycopersicum TaxID=4081 RepID=A0A3Q7JLH2_SOLLC
MVIFFLYNHHLCNQLNNPAVGIWATLCLIYGFKRELYLRKHYSKIGSYNFTPSLNKLRSFTVVGTFLQQNIEFSELNYQISSSRSPHIVEDTILSTALLLNSNMKV